MIFFDCENVQVAGMEKQKLIDLYKEGDRIKGIFLVKSARLAETRNGKPYLLVGIGDKSGEITGPIWDDAVRIAEFCKPGSFVELEGSVQSYREKLQLRIEKVTPASESQVDLKDFVPQSDRNIDKMAKEIGKAITSLENPDIRKLLQVLFKEGDTWENFKKAPAAKGIHHAFTGGLLEHCHSMLKVAEFAAAHYPGIDRSLLIAGVLLHDIGKIVELVDTVGVIEYSVAGRLKGHIVLGCEMVARAAAKIDGFPQETLLAIQHLIASHHGRMEFGSPVVPMTPEAILLNYIDEMDSKMGLVEALRKKIKKNEACWSDYQSSLERFLYLTPLDRPSGDDADSDATPGKQGLLF